MDVAYVKNEILPDYFKYLWVRRMAMDKRQCRALIEATVEIAGLCFGSASNLRRALLTLEPLSYNLALIYQYSLFHHICTVAADVDILCIGGAFAFISTLLIVDVF